MSKIYYGNETEKSLKNFPISRIKVDYRIIWALSEIKKAAAITNEKLGKLPKNISKAIQEACDEVKDRKFDDQFVTTVIQGGAGTSINMNTNEVIANRASEILKKPFGYVSDLDHVNMAQSTNDTIPTAIKIASIRLLKDCVSELTFLSKSFEKKSKEFKNVIKVGRTHLQDAVPISLGQEFHAYSMCAKRGVKRLNDLINGELLYVNLGGTAVGTGIGSSKLFIKNVVNELSKITNIKLKNAPDLIDGTQNVDVFVDVSGRLKSIFSSFSKIASDLRAMAAGPRANICEIVLPERQKGSSIMPGKINPVMPELINQVYFQILGNDATITEASSQGQFELNVMGSVLAFNLIQSLSLARNSLEVFRTHCIDGIKANKERCKELLDNSFCTVTALNKHIGYYNATKVAQKAFKTGKTIKEIVLEEKMLSEDNVDDILNPENLIYPE